MWEHVEASQVSFLTIGLHQWLVLISYLFAIVMDELTKLIQAEVPLFMIFVDDTVLVNETRSGVNAKLEIWIHTLESIGFQLVRTKIDFSKSIKRDVVRLDGQKILKSGSFWYLGSIIHKDGEIEDYGNHRISAW